LPLVIQKMEDVESIVIDSLRIRVKDEPMSGFLYTTGNTMSLHLIIQEESLRKGKKA